MVLSVHLYDSFSILAAEDSFSYIEEFVREDEPITCGRSKNENIKCPVKIAFMLINRIAPHIMYITGVTNFFIIPYLLYFFVFSDNATRSYYHYVKYKSVFVTFPLQKNPNIEAKF
jgi:hypothetical protein